MLRVLLETSCPNLFRAILTQGVPDCFTLVEDPGTADLVVFQRSSWSYVRRSTLFRAHPFKCICVSEWDKPSFLLPGIYASNRAAWYTRGRSQTSHYPVARRQGWNQDAVALSPATAEKKYLYSFMGKCSSLVRKRLFRHYGARPGWRAPADVLVEATDDLVQGYVAYVAGARRRYAEVMAASKYALCPRGWGTSSVRLFEACEMGIAPVILADRWVPISGIDWSFALFIEEGRVADIDGILRAHESEWAERGRRARLAYQEHFADGLAARILHQHMTRLLAQLNLARERRIRRIFPAILLAEMTKERLRKAFVSFRPPQ